MLKVISILTLLYFLSSTALPESNYDHDSYGGHKDNNQKPLPLQLAEAASRNYYEAGGKQVKPCSRRKLKNPLDTADQELLPTPTYTARVIKPYQGNTNNLTPQSLRNSPNQDSAEVTELQNRYKNTKADNDKLNEDNKDGKNVYLSGDNGYLDNHDVGTKADNKKLDEESVDRENSKANSKAQDVSENSSKVGDNYEVNSNNDKFYLENYSVNNDDDDLNSRYHYGKNLQAQSKEPDDVKSKSSNKYLTEAQFKDLTGNSDSKELDGAGYKNSNYNTNKDLYHSDTLVSEDNESMDLLNSDEIAGAIHNVKLNRASSDELNDALYEIRKHMAHSEELKDALKEVGKKGRVYNNLLTDALYKVKKHEALSEESNKNRQGVKSSESDLSDEDSLYDGKSRLYSNEKYGKGNSLHKKSKIDSPSKTDYKESDYQSREEDSYENDHKCPSKQENLATEQLEASRRFLSDSDEVKLSDSASSKHTQKDAGSRKKTKKYNHDKNYSQTADGKVGEEYKKNKLQTSAVLQHHNKARKGYLDNPAQGQGISPLSAGGLNLMDHMRVCYACSSEFNPTCYEPNRLTTVKYCLYGHDNCVTKTYTNSENRQVVIRDCADSCDVGNAGTDAVWNSCDICSSDLCNDRAVSPNSAFSMNSQSLMFTAFVIFAVKFTM